MATRRETSGHREVFEAWYAAARNFRKISENLGIKNSTLYGWADVYFWHERADRRDSDAARIADEEAAKERATRAKKRRKAGELLTSKGMEFLEESGIESASVAIQAIKAGIEIERKEDGVPDWVMMILNADPSEVEKFVRDVANASFGGEEADGSHSALEGESESDPDE